MIDSAGFHEDPWAPADKASASGGGDCGFWSHLGPHRARVLYIPAEPGHRVPVWHVEMCVITNTVFGVSRFATEHRDKVKASEKTGTNRRL